MSSEFISDSSARIVIIAQQLGVTHHTACMLAAEWEQSITADWKGERPYIGARAGRAMSERDRAILRYHQAGERVPLIARRFEISRARVWNILRDFGAVQGEAPPSQQATEAAHPGRTTRRRTGP